MDKKGPSHPHKYWIQYEKDACLYSEKRYAAVTVEFSPLDVFSTRSLAEKEMEKRNKEDLEKDKKRKKEIAEVQRQLAATANDPNIVISSAPHFDPRDFTTAVHAEENALSIMNAHKLNCDLTFGKSSGKTNFMKTGLANLHKDQMIGRTKRRK